MAAGLQDVIAAGIWLTGIKQGCCAKAYENVHTVRAAATRHTNSLIIGGSWPAQHWQCSLTLQLVGFWNSTAGMSAKYPVTYHHTDGMPGVATDIATSVAAVHGLRMTADTTNGVGHNSQPAQKVVLCALLM